MALLRVYYTEGLELVFTTTEETDYVPEVTIDTDTWKYTAKFEKWCFI